MTLPRDTTPMYVAIVAALTTSTGQPRALGPTSLFVLGQPGEAETPPRAGDLFRRRVCWVPPIRWAPIDPQLQMTDRMRIDAVIEVRCWYYAGDGIGTREWDTASAIWSRDAFDVGHALTYPAALYYAPDGQRTGLDGGSLRADDRRHEPDVRALPRRESNVNGVRYVSPLVVQVGHVFRATAELARPA